MGLREYLHETMGFTIKYRGLWFQISLQPIQWICSFLAIMAPTKKTSKYKYKSKILQENDKSPSP